MTSNEDKNAIIGKLYKLIELREKFHEVPDDEFTYIMEQILRPSNDELSSIRKQHQDASQRNASLLSLRLEAVKRDLSNVIDILKTIEGSKILSDDDKIKESVNDMASQLDGLFHEMVGKVLPFYQMLNDEKKFDQEFTILRQSFENNPPNKKNIVFSCNRLHTDLINLENHNGIADHLPTVNKELKDLHTFSHQWILKDDPVKLILDKLTSNMKAALTANSWNELKTVLSPSKIYLEGLMDFHMKLPCREQPPIQYSL